MHDRASDTRVPLEWHADGNYWIFPLMEQEWADFRGLLGRDDSGYTQIDAKNFHIERTSGGEYRILWTAPNDERPPRAYGLVAVRPKKPGTFLGVPLAVLIPIVTALATAVGTIAVQTTAGWGKSPTVNKVFSESQKWVSAAELERCTTDLRATESANKALESCLKKEQTLHEFILSRPSKDRVLYLLGRSHGQRLEAIRRLHDTAAETRDIALQAEKAYVENVLIRETDSLAFTTGKSRGQKEAVKLLGLGELQFLSGEDFNELR